MLLNLPLPARRLAPWLAILLCIAPPARADGEMVLGDRVLFRRGPEPDACRDPRDCDTAQTKILSGFGYLRGHVIGAASAELPRPRGAGLAALRLTAASAALPGGELAIARIDGVLASQGTHRLRSTLAEAEGLFVCRDARTGGIELPFVGMTTTHCQPDAVIAVDARVMTAQWERGRRLQIEWFALGPSFELLANGLGYAHLLRSLMLGVGIDLRSSYDLMQTADVATSLGAGLRASWSWRSPRWEVRVRARHRTTLVGGAGLMRDNTVAAELHWLHNFLWNDALLLQAGLTASVSYQQDLASGFELWSGLDRHWGGWLGFYLGWLSAPPDI